MHLTTSSLVLKAGSRGSIKLTTEGLEDEWRDLFAEKKKRAATYQNLQKTSVRQRLRSACISAQSDQSSVSAWSSFESLATQRAPSKDWSTCPRVTGWSESSLATHRVFCCTQAPSQIYLTSYSDFIFEVCSAPWHIQMSQHTTKPTKWPVSPANSDQSAHPPGLCCPHKETLGPNLPT